MASEKEWQQDISTTVDTHTNKLFNHENRLNQAELNVADHEKRINNIETTSDVGQIATRVQAIEDKNTEQDSAIDTLKKSVSDNLQTAKDYTNTQLQSYATKQENTDALNQAKQYTDNETANALNQANNHANQTFLPLTGGNLTGSLWTNVSDTDVEKAQGLNTPIGKIYLYGNKTNKGLHCLNSQGIGHSIIAVDDNNNVTFTGTLKGRADTASIADQANLLNTRSHPTTWALYADFKSSDNEFHVNAINKYTGEWKGVRVYSSVYALQLKTTSNEDHHLNIYYDENLGRFCFQVLRDSDSFTYNCWVERANTCAWAEGTDNAPNGIRINGVLVTVG